MNGLGEHFHFDIISPQFCTVVSCICLHPSCPVSKRNAHPRDKRILARQYQPAGVEDAAKNEVQVQSDMEVSREVERPERKRRLSGPFSKSAPPAIGHFGTRVEGGSGGGIRRGSWRLPFRSGSVRPMERAPLERQRRVEQEEEEEKKDTRPRRPSTCPELGRGRRYQSSSADILKRGDIKSGNRSNIVIQVQQVDDGEPSELLDTTKL